MQKSEFVVICQNCKDFWIGNDIQKCGSCGSASLQVTHPSNRQYAKNLPKSDWQIIKDIDELIDRLQHLKNFIIDKIEDDDMKFFRSINTTHTDIKLLSNKLKYK